MARGTEIRCDVCGEKIRCDASGFYLDDVGEFDDPKTGDAILAHADCGIGAGYDLA